MSLVERVAIVFFMASIAANLTGTVTRNLLPWTVAGGTLLMVGSLVLLLGAS